MSKPKLVYCYGELLWDCFPEREILGGAPFNVAYRLHSLGTKVELISAVGNDVRGQDALNGLVEFGLKIRSVKVHPKIPTGFVQVHLDANGAATYTIAEPVAWDRIPVPSTSNWSDSILIFGSLALRNDFNKAQLEGLIEKSDISVFDINLRPPHYNMEYLVQLIHKCDCLKLNEEELLLVLKTLRINDHTLADQLKTLASRSNTATICVTLGAAGAALWHKGSFYSHSGFPAEVADTVGAGDAFLAGFVHTLYIGDKNPEEALGFGCALGSLVASKEGATALVELEEINRLLE